MEAATLLAEPSDESGADGDSDWSGGGGSFEDAVRALARRMDELSEAGSAAGLEEDDLYDLGLRFPPEPPEAFCEVPECAGPDPSELWLDGPEQGGLGDIWDGVVGLALVSLLVGAWWLGAEAAAGRGVLVSPLRRWRG
mmetsp:Transcript_71122/g.200712  ORF Transcript_71122/g.200712 Transcript_71122/m.200712 type:complete len:139 (-) Transcript_71122:8-424(-)